MKGCCSYMKRVDHLTYRDPYYFCLRPDGSIRAERLSHPGPMFTELRYYCTETFCKPYFRPKAPSLVLADGPGQSAGLICTAICKEMAWYGRKTDIVVTSHTLYGSFLGHLSFWRQTWSAQVQRVKSAPAASCKQQSVQPVHLKVCLIVQAGTSRARLGTFWWVKYRQSEPSSSQTLLASSFYP